VSGAALRVRSLTRRFGARAALDGVDLDLRAGGRLAVLGASGSGKTTLLRLLAGLDAPDEGEVALDGRVASRKGAVLVPPEERATALVFQGLALWPHLTALQQIAFAARGDERRAQARALAERLGLGDRCDARPDALSGGERQRLALARALAQDPRLFLLDEPFSHLDAPLRAALEDDVRNVVAETGATLVMVTHSRDEALALADELLVLEAGRALQLGSVADVVAKPRTPRVALSLGLGTILEGRVDGDRVETPLGPVPANTDGRSGNVSLLARPEQLVIGESGVEASVVRSTLAWPEAEKLRWKVRVAIGELALDVRAAGPPPSATIRVALEGAPWVFPG
jgi:ABC-type Fe3+/spermidine/putrescine transport system ATPase subunit